MIQSLRVWVAVMVVLAVTGCQKGTQSGAKGSGGTSDVSSSPESTGAQASAGKTDEGATKTDEGPAKTDEHAAKAAGGSQAGGKSSTLTAVDDGSVVDLRVGQVLTVVLSCNRSTGLSWVMVKPTATVIVPEGKPVYAAASKAETDGTETWHFRANQRGEQTVRLEYRREWQQTVPERAFRFTAVVH